MGVAVGTGELDVSADTRRIDDEEAVSPLFQFESGLVDTVA